MILNLNIYKLVLIINLHVFNEYCLGYPITVLNNN